MQARDPDVQLMLAYRAGDASALGLLYGRWAPRLLRYLEQIVRQPAVAEELLQETFVRVLDARERYAPEARFSTWLFHIARNLALNELARARSRHPHCSTDAADDAAPDGGPNGRPRLVLVAPTPDPAEEVDGRRRYARVAAALSELPERQQTALWLAAVEREPYEEIAAVLGSSVQSVKNLVHRARATLVDQLRMPASAAPASEEKG